MRDLENNPLTHLPLSLKVGDIIVSDKKRMADIFNQPFIKSSYTVCMQLLTPLV